MPPLLEAALNGSRSVDEHPWIPRTPGQLAITARAAIDAGAQVLHLHPYDPDGRETFETSVCAAALRAVRFDCPGVPISLTTSAAIEPDPDRRFLDISQWHQLPELVTANQGEEGILELCEYLMGRGVGIEAGLLSVGDAEAFIRSGIATRCVRVLVEPLDPEVDVALGEAAAIEEILAKADISLEQVHHGEGVPSWAVSARGLARGHGMRTGLEDTIYLPSGVRAADNAHLISIAAAMVA
jgi:uncharacterized protein (DUF849 family)